MSLLRDYSDALTQPTLPEPPAGTAGEASPRYDEVVAADGTLRPAWKGLAAVAVDLTPEELRRVDGEIATLLADDGVTYGRTGDRAEPWRLDPLPLVIDAAGWAPLEVGLAQRAELLDAVLADLYGPRRLLAEGILPAAAVYGHSGYSRIVAGHPDARPLLLTAADLGRDADGEWRVIADRVQAPSGLGYTMENRRVISRVLPELYHEAGLHRVEPYFSAVRTALLGAVPDGAADPRVVVLSPGTRSETAYDQAFLASILGFPLVQGSDLVVRDGDVWMKPAGWPAREPVERVDVILRRVDADWSDPLELRADSQLGVAGLAQAVRRGRVRVLNGLGAGVLENPALLPFLPAVCEALLGEQLRLPSVPTWWCGDPDSLALVLDRLEAAPDSLIVRTIDRSRAKPGRLAPRALRERILAAPHRYAAQERLPLSQAPVRTPDGRVVPRPIVLRAFTVRHGSAFRPLAGGMATALDDEQAALGSKDVWVLKSAATEPDQGLVTDAPVTRVPSVTVLAPRALEDMYWSGRYAERAEDLLRLVLATHSSIERPTGTAAAAASPSAPALTDAIARLAGTRHAELDDELRSLLLDADRPGSVAQSLERLRNALEGVRDQLSGDTWRAFGDTDRAVRSLGPSRHRQQIAESAGRMLTGVLALQGVTASMIRDAGWHMIGAGRYLERSLQLCSLLAATTTVHRGIDADREVLTAVVTTSESVVTHRRRYRGDMRTAGVLELLLMDPDNPRSLTFSLGRLRVHLAAMPASTGSTRPERLLDRLVAGLEDVRITALVERDDDRRPALAGYLDDTIAQLLQLADAIAEVHFAGGPAPQPISSMSLTEVTGAVS